MPSANQASPFSVSRSLFRRIEAPCSKRSRSITMSRSCPAGRGSKSLGVRLELPVAIAKVKAPLSKRRPKSNEKVDVAHDPILPTAEQDKVAHTVQKSRITPKQPDGQPLAANCETPPW